jgi:hypothetical protein
MRSKTIADNIAIPTREIVGGLISFIDSMGESEEEELGEEIWLLELAAARIITSVRTINFLGVGLIVSNLFWALNTLGYI